MSASNCPETPRQKMIGMMYLFLTAMLALNVSTEVLNGFTMVDQSLVGSIKSAQVKNQYIYEKFDYLASQNPDKAKEWLNKSKEFKAKSDSLFNEIQSLKEDIVRTVDGPEYDVENIKTRDNLDVPGQLTLPPTGNRGAKLREMIESYQQLALTMMPDTLKQASIRSNFDVSRRAKANGDGTISWEESVFYMMPVAASVAILSKLQNDIKSAEAEVIDYLILQVDASDFRVNKIDALVIPESNYVIKGGKYSAQIVLAAMDSTSRPKIFIGDKELESSTYEVSAGSVGTFPVKGRIVMRNPLGQDITYPFESSYVVGEPSVTISADMMNVFYAGIENPISVSVPGIPSQSLTVTMTNGTITRTAKGWNVKPARVGQECNISVSAKLEGGKVQNMGSRPFRVKALPPPVAYIQMKDAAGLPQKYKGEGKGIAKAALLASPGIKAELDDEDLDVKYQVLGFETNFFDSMGNTLIEVSDGDKFSSRQMDSMRKTVRGKKFFITKIRAKGPDGIERILPPIEVIVN